MILKDMTLSGLRDWMRGHGEPTFRGDQVFGWLYRHEAESLSQMKNIGEGLRSKLEGEGSGGLMTLSSEKTLKSKDGTHKFLFKTADGLIIETALMPYSYGVSVCVSSQAGCRMGCAFCASGIKGLIRNLSPGEMADQVLLAGMISGMKPTHVVVMGTGEPMDNIENLMSFLGIICEPSGLGISRRRVTVSTCGLLKPFEEFWRAWPQVGLAISLHATDDRIRRSLIPTSKSAGVDALIEAARACAEGTGRRVTFEYALIKDINDGEGHARILAAKLKGMLCHVNLIALNPVPETDFKPSGSKAAAAFQAVLEEAGTNVTLRREMGRDIAAACGQLRISQGF